MCLVMLSLVTSCYWKLTATILVARLWLDKHTRTHTHRLKPLSCSQNDIKLTSLYRSPDTGDGNWADGPGIFPHNVVLWEVVTGREVISGPLARGAGRAGELVGQVFMRLAGCADPAAVLT